MIGSRLSDLISDSEEEFEKQDEVVDLQDIEKFKQEDMYEKLSALRIAKRMSGIKGSVSINSTDKNYNPKDLNKIFNNKKSLTMSIVDYDGHNEDYNKDAFENQVKLQCEFAEKFNNGKIIKDNQTNNSKLLNKNNNFILPQGDNKNNTKIKKQSNKKYNKKNTPKINIKQKKKKFAETKKLVRKTKFTFSKNKDKLIMNINNKYKQKFINDIKNKVIALNKNQKDNKIKRF